ncbi:MAG: hypothetical protein JSS07_09225 [Proteobacteria bacterium]|nr:hypothetical protein [Pseudomonadota bacterium]
MKKLILGLLLICAPVYASSSAAPIQGSPSPQPKQQYKQVNAHSAQPKVMTRRQIEEAQQTQRAQQSQAQRPTRQIQQNPQTRQVQQPSQVRQVQQAHTNHKTKHVTKRTVIRKANKPVVTHRRVYYHQKPQRVVVRRVPNTGVVQHHVYRHPAPVIEPRVRHYHYEYEEPTVIVRSAPVVSFGYSFH